MDFREAHDRLNQHDIAAVAAEMVDWHPAILGSMLLAVQAAKIVRYRSPHPDYYSPLQACMLSEPESVRTHGRTDINADKATIREVVEQLEQP